MRYGRYVGITRVARRSRYTETRKTRSSGAPFCNGPWPPEIARKPDVRWPGFRLRVFKRPRACSSAPGSPPIATTPGPNVKHSNNWSLLLLATRKASIGWSLSPPMPAKPILPGRSADARSRSCVTRSGTAGFWLMTKSTIRAGRAARASPAGRASGTMVRGERLADPGPRQDSGDRLARDALDRLAQEARSRATSAGAIAARACRRIKRRDQPRSHRSPPDSPKTSTIEFRDDAAAAGLCFTYDNGESPQHQVPETIGGGVAVLDYDGDGWLDVYVVQGGPTPGHPGLGRSKMRRTRSGNARTKRRSAVPQQARRDVS